MQEIDCSFLWKERTYREGAAPSIACMQIPGKRGMIYATCYLAGRDMPRPAVLLCHGFPGNEQQLDLAQALRRIGFHVMTFHYSGCWGSEGDYSFLSCLEDTETVIDYMLCHSELAIDQDRLVLIGHSMGGFVAANTLAKRREFAAGVLITPGDLGGLYCLAEGNNDDENKLRHLLGEGACWLKGTDAYRLYEELGQYKEQWRFTSLAESLSQLPLLLIGGSRDEITPAGTNIFPLLEALSLQNGSLHEYKELLTDHYQSDMRLTLAETVADFLKRRL